MPNIIDLVKQNPINHSLVLHVNCSLQDVCLTINKIKKSDVSYNQFRWWEISGGFDAGFGFSASGTLDHPEACAGMSAWLEVNRLGGEFLYLGGTEEEHIGKGCFINDRSFHFEIGFPNCVVRDILMKLCLFNPVHETQSRKFGARIDLTDLCKTDPNQSVIEFKIVRLYI